MYRNNLILECIQLKQQNETKTKSSQINKSGYKNEMMKKKIL